jgi:uncharacterized protein (DUF3820 family)
VLKERLIGAPGAAFGQDGEDFFSDDFFDGASRLHAMDSEHLEMLVTRVMPYGKYKGRLIADLPGHYLNWFAREGFPPGELGRLLALMHELDHNGLSSLLESLRKRGNHSAR